MVAVARKRLPESQEELEATPVDERYLVKFSLASGNQLVINAGLLQIEVPKLNVTMELCGALQCSQFHLHPDDFHELESRALAANITAQRRLARGWTGGQSCRMLRPPPGLKR